MPLRALVFFLAFLFFATSGLFSQEEEDDIEPPPIDTEWFDFDITGYDRGDRTFTISMGTIFPTVFDIDRGPSHSPRDHNFRVVGGTGSLAFNYFLSPNIFVGGELGGMFLATRGERMFFMVPFGVRVGYQFVHHRFEFPISVLVGGAPQMMQDQRYFGFITQVSASGFWRFNADWSFGLNTVWWIVPQRPGRQDGLVHNAIGNFLTVTLAARYHF